MTYSKAPLAYRAASLETAACLWEAVLLMESRDDALAAQIRDAREMLGSSHLRLTVIGWTDLVDAAWIAVDGDDGLGNSGQYENSFDWDFVPGWIVDNIDWSNPSSPEVRKV